MKKSSTQLLHFNTIRYIISEIFPKNTQHLSMYRWAKANEYWRQT